MPYLAPQIRTAFRSIASNTGLSSPGELETIRSTSEVAVCCSRASANSRVRKATCSCRLATVELRRRAAVGALLRFGFVVSPCRFLARLRLIVRRRLTERSPRPTTIPYHIVRSVVHHSKFGCRLAAQRQERRIRTVCNISASTPKSRPRSGHARRGREMIDLLAVEEPNPKPNLKPAKIPAVSHEAAIDQLFKRTRSSGSALTQQAVSNPRSPVPNERRRRRSPRGRRTGTTSEWPPATRGSPPARAKDGPGRGPPPQGRARSRCTSRGARTRPGTQHRQRTSVGRRRTPG